MPNLKQPCSKCGGKARHKRDCADKRGSKSEPWTRDRLAVLVRSLSDDQLGDLVSLVVAESSERTARIEEEAAARVARIRAILPARETPPPLKSVGLPSHEEPVVPAALQCPAICPENVEVKCTQARNHEGSHYNRVVKRAWQRR